MAQDGSDAFAETLAELAERRQEFRERRHVPRDFVDRLKGLGLYRAATLFPIQQATPTERGFRVSGRWKFASGCMAADIVCVGIPGDDATSGKPRGALVRPGRLEIVQDWDVVGMQGTGSFDLIAKDVEVDREWTFIRGGEPVIDEPLYRYPAITYAAQSLSVVSAEQNAHLRLSAAYLARTSSEVVHRIVSLSGTAAIYRDHPLQALLGDVLVPQEHAFLSPAMYDAAGAVFMGLPPTVPSFR
ncbi:hypothetical protein [Nonomuraea sp. NPDC050643]|uniref:hypothetical protein n=1 Tax=Nonomuraea sp. NPDC050643 TaxID=3155660 RepID=UPI00340AEE64